MNAARSAILVGLDPGAEDKDRVLVHVKQNLSPLGSGPKPCLPYPAGLHPAMDWADAVERR